MILKIKKIVLNIIFFIYLINRVKIFDLVIKEDGTAAVRKVQSKKMPACS